MNRRSRYGELDIIARYGDTIAFIEVKARRSRGHGAPFEAVDRRKQRQIGRLAAMWLAERQHDRTLASCRFRFDVISVWLTGDDRQELVHIPDAFRPGF